jgi:hypothetical protein
MLFGTIVHWLAQHEVLLQQIAATIIGSRSSDVMLLTKDLTLAEKRIAVLDLLRHREIPRDQFDAVLDYLKIPETFRLLSRDIEHSAWIAGDPPSSIQPNWILRPKPAIKPVHGGLDGRTDHFLEDYDDQVQYTVDQLAETAETLRHNYQQFFTYCRSVGLVAEIDQKS